MPRKKWNAKPEMQLVAREWRHPAFLGFEGTLPSIFRKQIGPNNLGIQVSSAHNLNEANDLTTKYSVQQIQPCRAWKEFHLEQILRRHHEVILCSCPLEFSHSPELKTNAARVFWNQQKACVIPQTSAWNYGQPLLVKKAECPI